MDFEKKMKIESWKRLGKLVLAIIGLVLIVLFMISNFDESQEQEKHYGLDDEDLEIMHELND